MPQLRTFNRDFDVGGRPADGFDDVLAARLGRALSTFVKRREIAAGPVVVGREVGADTALRDGLVQGLLIAGEDVLDLQTCSAGEFETSLGAYTAKAGAFLAREDDVATIAIFVRQMPLTQGGLLELFAVEEEGCFPVGEGTLRLRGAVEAENSTHRTAVDH